MKNLRFIAALFLAFLPALLIGCGGGSGGGGTPSATATPTAAPTATLGPRALTVQLRDNAGRRVEGIVTVGNAVVSTNNGDATFNRDIAAGTATVSAEVDGSVTTGQVTVQNTGTTTFVLRVSPRVTPVPGGTIPPSPFPT